VALLAASRAMGEEFKESVQKLHFYHRFYFEKAGCAFVTMPENTDKSPLVDPGAGKSKAGQLHASSYFGYLRHFYGRYRCHCQEFRP
jgi:hypothetical protein